MNWVQVMNITMHHFFRSIKKNNNYFDSFSKLEKNFKKLQSY